MREQPFAAGNDRESFIPTIIDIEDARDFIHERIENGERPVVTVPSQYKDLLSSGLYEHSTWIENVSLITGTIGRTAYVPDGEERVAVIIKSIDESQIEPRMTGKDHAFHGVVILKGPITPDQIEIMET